MVFCNNKLGMLLHQRVQGHNPYFNRWFSAISDGCKSPQLSIGHNPYFNRWFSAIEYIIEYFKSVLLVTILILIDGFLQ